MNKCPDGQPENTTLLLKVSN